MELKQFSNLQEFLKSYNFRRGNNDEVGSYWFLCSVESQLKSFNKGLGKITYFQTIKRDLEEDPYMELESSQNRIPVMYKMIIDYILIDKYIHDVDCQCGCTKEYQAQLLKLDGFDACYLGVGESYGEPASLIYDYSKIIEQLQQDGMDQEEAEEYFECNILGSYVGEKMPIFLNRIPLNELDIS